MLHLGYYDGCLKFDKEQYDIGESIVLKLSRDTKKSSSLIQCFLISYNDQVSVRIVNLNCALRVCRVIDQCLVFKYALQQNIYPYNYNPKSLLNTNVIGTGHDHRLNGLVFIKD